jgi:transposase-like protein
MRGKKGARHSAPDDPPRRRANKRRGHGEFAGDRPAVHGVVSRESGEVHLRVVATSAAIDLVPPVLDSTPEGSTVNTDELGSYNALANCARGHKSVNHSEREWARDDDGDGVREVHTNRMEGTWMGLRNFLRTFRGVSKHYLAQYAAVFEWWNNLKRATADFLRAVLTAKPDYVPRGCTLCRR